MGNSKILDHTADLIIEFSGENLEDLLNACAEGLSIYLYDRKGEKSDFTYKRVFKSKEREEFLIDFLNEILFLMQNKKFIPFNVLIKEENEKYIVYFKGEKSDLKPFSEIKAATYHNLKIIDDGNFLRTVITFDL